MTYLHLVLFQRDRCEWTFCSSLQRIKTYFITCMNLEGSGSGWYQMTRPPQSSLFGSTLQLRTACLQNKPTDLQLCKNTRLWLVQQASTYQRPNPANCMDHGCLWSITNIIIIQKIRSPATAYFQSHSKGVQLHINATCLQGQQFAHHSEKKNHPNWLSD